MINTSDDPRTIVSFQHDLRWKGDASILVPEGGDFVGRTESGTEIEYSLSALEPRYFLRTAPHKGYRGWFQGMEKGEYHFEHEVWDLSDPVAVREYTAVGGGCDHGVGAHSGGELRGGVFEYFMIPRYPKYRDARSKR